MKIIRLTMQISKRLARIGKERVKKFLKKKSIEFKTNIRSCAMVLTVFGNGVSDGIPWEKVHNYKPETIPS